MTEVGLGLVGAGLVGKRHVAALAAARGVRLAALADPDPAARATAESAGVPWFSGLDEMLEAGLCDGILLATPNGLHEAGALACIGAGLPVLVEKPLAADAEAARRMVAAARKAGVILATGHHRRHNPLIARARALIDEGRLGRIATVQATFWLSKPEDYFGADWRRRAGAGPVYINLIHDIDLLQYLCGPIAEVHAIESNAVRGFEVEDSAAVVLRFASGALGTVNIADCVPAPLSWELTARENPAYPATSENCYWLGGTEGALALPNLALWRHEAGGSWWDPISATRFPVETRDPLVAQAEDFARAIATGGAPLVSGEDGLAAIEVIDAIKASAAQGRTITLARRSAR